MDRFDRLLDGDDATEFERTLLDAASDDAPSDHARRRTLAAMGAGAAAVTSASHAATQVAAAGAAGGGAKGIGAVSAVALLKWVGTGAVVGSIVAAGIATVTTPGLVFSKRAVAPVAEVAAETAIAPEHGVRGRSLATAAAEVTAPESAVAEPGSPPEPTRAAAPSQAARAERSAVTPPAAVVATPLAPAAAPVVPQVSAASTVVAEVESLDRARAALAAGNPQAALSSLSRHDAAFPAGVLQPEAVVLRVRALIALGDRAEAARVGNRFITSHPDSAQAGRLRALIGQR